MNPQMQVALMNASVLVVGAGGLGCPVVAYLAGAGIGHVGVMDDDEVHISNLHRQILHTETGAKERMKKTDSIRRFVGNLNGDVRCTVYNSRFVGDESCLKIVRSYDVVVDCTDNVASRYLINDACVLAGRPLVFGAAVGFDGHVSVFNGSKDGPCYRCVHPDPPSQAAVGSCSNDGILGPVVGATGSLMALEVIKYVTGLGESAIGRLCIVDGWSCRFRSVRLPPRRADCRVCCGRSAAAMRALRGRGNCVRACPNPKCKCKECTCGEGCTCGVSMEVVCDPCRDFKKAMMAKRGAEKRTDEIVAREGKQSDTIRNMSDAAKFCANHGLCPSSARRDDDDGSGGGVSQSSNDECDVSEYSRMRLSKTAHLLIDVRPRSHFSIYHLPGSRNVPLASLEDALSNGILRGYVADVRREAGLTIPSKDGDEMAFPIYVICLRGIKSRVAASNLRMRGWTSSRHICGGLIRWKRDIDSTIPLYDGL